MKRKEAIKEIAKKIYNLEQKILLGKDVQKAQQEIEILMSTLSIAEIFQLDNYIMENKNNFTFNK